VARIGIEEKSIKLAAAAWTFTDRGRERSLRNSARLSPQSASIPKGGNLMFLRLVILYLLTAVAFFAIDFLWLTRFVPKFYRSNLGDILLPKVNAMAGSAFYVIYLMGVLAVVVVPSVRNGALGDAVWKGAVVGLISYATYDLTNLATLKGWSAKVSLVDMTWGTALTAVVCLVSYFIGQWLNV
jgi:uncharacterized membrane protein